MRRSIALERLGPLPFPHLGDRIVGPSKVYADAEVNVPADAALVRIDYWLVDGHHLRRDVLRSGHGEWSKRSGLVGATVRTIRNWTGEGKLGDFERITAETRDSGGESSVVRITIDRATNRRWVGGGGIAIAVGALAGVVLAAMSATPLVLLLLLLLLGIPAAITAGVAVCSTGRKQSREAEREIRRLLDAVRAGAAPTRLSVDVVRRATGKATTAGSSALGAVGRTTPTPALPPAGADMPHQRVSVRRRRGDN